MEIEKKSINGTITFFYNEGGIAYYINDKNDEEYKGMADFYFRPINIYHLMSGEEFADAVDKGFFIDYDGSLADVLVDGYQSNLGICTNSFHQGNFMVDINTFREICSKSKVEVNWANK